MTIQLSTLSNGLKVITDHYNAIETVSLGIWVNVGSRHESIEINGISHMLEHMAFRGTTTQTAQEIAEKIESVGGHLNAYTSRDSTAYYARILHQDAELASSILTDILQYSTFKEEELERERAVILQEISQIQDSPQELVFDYWQETAYPFQAYGRPIAGQADIVGRMTRDEIKSYMTSHYATENMIFAAAGKVNHDHIVQIIQDQFTSVMTNTPLDSEPAVYKGGDFRIQKDLEQVHLILGFEGISLNHPDYYNASILATILGSGMSSRLFQEVREKRGLAYGIYSFSTSAYDTGVFGIYTSAGPQQVKELLPVICDEILKVSSTLIEKEIIRAKNQLKASLLMALESPSTRCRQLAIHMMVYGHPLDSDEIVKRIEAVTLQDLSRLAKAIFSGTPTLSTIGPIAQVMPYEKMCAHLNVKPAASV